MSFRHLLLMSVAIVGCSSPEDTKLIESSTQRMERMDSTMAITDRGDGYATMSNGKSKVTFTKNGFDYSFAISNPAEIVNLSHPFLAYEPTKFSNGYPAYLECISEDRTVECKEFSCQSTSKDGMRIIRVTMNQGD